MAAKNKCLIDIIFIYSLFIGSAIIDMGSTANAWVGKEGARGTTVRARAEVRVFMTFPFVCLSAGQP